MRTGRRTEIANVETLRRHLADERDAEVRLRLALLNLVATMPASVTLAEICEGMGVPTSTAYVWLRAWRERGYAGLRSPAQTNGRGPGAPPKLDDAQLAELERLLEERPAWETADIRALIKAHWGVELSTSQIRRILRNKLGMYCSKPYPHDFRRPADAEEQLEQRLIEVYADLMDQGLDEHDIAIGFLDESSPQLTANTVRLWHFGDAHITKNTAKLKANTIGFYAVVGDSVHGFLHASTQEDIAAFLPRIREANAEYGVVVVIHDNFSSHHAAAVRAAAEEHDILMVALPPYAPDLNPIEFIWKSIKRVVSVNFIPTTEDLRRHITAAWQDAVRHCSFARHWVDRFMPSLSAYKEFCG
jgi:transposase